MYKLKPKTFKNKKKRKNQLELQSSLTVKQSSGLKTVGTIAEEDLDSASSPSDSTRLASEPDSRAGSDPSVESEQKNLR